MSAFVWLRAEWWYDHYETAKDEARERARFVAARLADRARRRQLRLHEAKPPVHPARAPIHETRTLGERIADGMAGAVGSWPFVIGQSIFILAWITLNTVAFIGHWDPYPWILLNLCMSTQAMYTGPILLLASNRQAAKDRARDDLEAQEVETSAAILGRLDALIADLHSHTTCAGHTTIGDTGAVTGQANAVYQGRGKPRAFHDPDDPTPARTTTRKRSAGSKAQP